MRICLVVEFFPTHEGADTRGGVETRAFYVAKHLARRHEVTVLTSRERETPPRQVISGVEVVRCGREREYTQKWDLGARASFVLAGRTLAGKFNLVEGQNFVSYPLAWWLSRKMGVPAVATYHDVWLGEWARNVGPGGVLGELAERYILTRKWSLIIANSHVTRDKLIRAGVPGERIEVIPTGVDLKFFEGLKVEKSRHPTICCISRLVEYKRVQDLIRALKFVREEVPGVRCRIVGSGPEEPNLRRLAESLGVGSSVEFLGFIPERRRVMEVLASSHVFCLPSTVEGMGLVLVESMACGVPFVASRLPALVETSGGKGGVFFEPTNVRQLAERLIALLTDETERRRLAREGRDRAKDFDWEVLVRQIERAYVDRCG
jgi:glycosyltransferase involved in cell wall biosynthesis